ncbi:hypothetical protein [Allorhizobium sonneratiae]|uniref:hypothetical protein n=1 Tax=Allorhizobium sonneratiae TaxID=2934936 RepID=UPI002033FA24|nr:hypothetical protein [Allorhizobium sonneratiae]
MIAGPTAGFAIERYESTHYTCSDLHQILQQQGAAILRYPSSHVPGLPLYDRYVRGDMQCGFSKTLEETDIPAKDTSHCPVYHCIDADPYDDGPFAPPGFR